MTTLGRVSFYAKAKGGFPVTPAKDDTHKRKGFPPKRAQKSRKESISKEPSL